MLPWGDIGICYLKRVPAHQLHMLLHCHSGSMACQIPAFLATGLDLPHDTSLDQQLAVPFP